MKLHLGCGQKYFDGWVHYDALSYEHIDVVGPVDQLSLEDEVADIIYASHLLEHFPRHEVSRVLEEWFRVLKPDGILRVAVPNFKKACELYLNSENNYSIDVFKGLICGGQKDQYDFHFNIFDEQSLTQLFLDVGFRTVENWDWRSTEHSHIDDYSQAYIPHMEKDSGTLVSLNLEAKK